MKCRNPECNAEINPNALFCGKCGTLTLSNCSNCGNPLPLTGKVKCCSKCGTMVSEMHPPKGNPPKAEPPKREPPKSEPPKSEPPKSEPPKREPPKSEPPKSEPPVAIGSIKKSIKGMNSRNWAMFVHPALCLLYMIINIVSMVNMGRTAASSSDPFAALGGGVSLLFANRMLGPLLAIMGIGTIFSIVGLFIKKPWAYLTAAIIQCIGLLVGLPVELLDVTYLFASLIMIALGFYAYYQVRKLESKTK